MKSPTEFRNQQLQHQISEQEKHGNVTKKFSVHARKCFAQV